MIPAYAPYDPTTADESAFPQITSDADRGSAVSNATVNPAGSPPSKLAMRDRNRTENGERIRYQRVSHATVLLTLNQLAVMSQNGIEIAEALETIATNCSNKRLALSLRQIHRAVNGGQPFSAAVASYGSHFPSTLPPMLAAAEATGQVPETLANVCVRLRGELQMRGTIIGALIYPLILIAASSIVMAALVLGVLPQFSKVFVSLGRPIPASTQMLLTLGDFSRAHWYWLLPLIISFFVSLFMLRHHPILRRPWNRFLMHGWPVRSAYRPLLAGRTFRTLSSMVQGGVPLLQSVRLARHTTSDLYWRDLLDRIEDNLIDGATASSAMSGVDFLPPESAQMMATAERTGRVAEILDSIGEFYEEEAGRRIKRLVVALEPAIILVMGVIVAGVVMSLLLPLLDVTSVG